MKIEAGRYKGKYVAGTMQFGRSKSGKDQIALDLALSNGVTATTFLSFAEAAEPYSKDRLKALGWGGEGHEIADACLTNEVDVSISYRTWEGKEQMDVQIEVLGRAKLKEEMQPAERSAFLSRLTGVKPGAKADDIPF